MERSFLLQRGVIDMETGAFPLTLFTNGEASDGHIIDIRGLQVPDHMTMFANHFQSPVERMGGLTNPRKAGQTTKLGRASLKMLGKIDMEGDGMWADIRRDVAHGISVGDVKAMSGSWDPIKSVPRASLPEKHYAFSKVEGGWDTPMFFEESRALEGSIVGLGSDSAALAGRSHDLKKPEHVRNFWNVLVHGDPLSRDKAMESVYVEAQAIEGWEEIECDDGKVMLPASVARAWGQSVDDDGVEHESTITSKWKGEEGSVSGIAERALENALTDTEQAPSPVSEQEEEAQPAPARATPTPEATRVLRDLPELQIRPERIARELRRWCAAEMGLIEYE